MDDDISGVSGVADDGEATCAKTSNLCPMCTTKECTVEKSVCTREKQIGGSGGSLEPPGPLS